MKRLTRQHSWLREIINAPPSVIDTDRRLPIKLAVKHPPTHPRLLNSDGGYKNQQRARRVALVAQDRGAWCAAYYEEVKVKWIRDVLGKSRWKSGTLQRWEYPVDGIKHSTDRIHGTTHASSDNRLAPYIHFENENLEWYASRGR